MAIDDDNDFRASISPEHPNYNVDDPNKLSQWTNLPEGRDQQAVEQYLNSYEMEAQELREEAAGQRIHIWPNAGKFIIPRENTFAAHAQLVDSGQLTFNPEAYPYSLKLLVESAHRPDMFDPEHKDYAKHANARRNLLVVLNDVMGMFMDDGEFNPGDEKFVPQLSSIARTLGAGLRHANSPMGRIFMPHLNVEHLNIEGEGAAHAYDFLLKRQRDPKFMATLRREMRNLTALPLREWGLPPKEDTPFCKMALDALPPADVLAMSPEESKEYVRTHNVPGQTASSKLLSVSQTRQSPPVDKRLNASELQETIALGHIILDWLKNIRFTDKSMQEIIETGEPEEKEQLRGAASKAVDYFRNYMQRALALQPELAEKEETQKAMQAADAVEHSIKLLAALEKPISTSQSMQISSDISQPEHWNELKDQKLGALMESLKAGMEDAIDALQQDQERQQQEAAEQTIEASFDNNRPRRGRRRRSSRQGGATQVTASQAARKLSADDMAKGEGIARHARPASSPSRTAAATVNAQATQTVNPAAAINVDMAVIREIGRTLARNGREASAVTPADAKKPADKSVDPITGLKSLNADEVPKPDDAALSAQDQLKRERDQNRANRRNQNNQPRQG